MEIVVKQPLKKSEQFEKCVLVILGIIVTCAFPPFGLIFCIAHAMKQSQAKREALESAQAEEKALNNVRRERRKQLSN